jgi:hypothetical protein
MPARVKRMSISFVTFSTEERGDTRETMTTTKRVVHVILLGLSLGACAASGGAGDDDDDDDDDAVLPEDPLVIDDLEDGDGSLPEAEGRIGSWYTYNDGKSTNQTPAGDFVPEAGGPEGSEYYAHTTGSGYTEWGAAMAFDLNAPADTKSAWDASAFTGISLKAKGNTTIFVALASLAVVPTDGGGNCTPSTMEGKECDDAHGKSLTLTSDWKDYEVPFADLAQVGWGLPATFDAKDLASIRFEIAENVSFDVSVDDVKFY